MRHSTFFSFTVLFGFALQGEGLGQGDVCDQATPIQGSGTWAFDSTQQSTSGFQGNGPCLFANTPFFRDGFYQWTASQGGDFQIDTNGSNFDTQLAVHAGAGCAAVCVAYDDDDGPGTRSLILLSGVVTGETYLIQVGGYNDQLGLVELRIGEVCAGPDDGFEDNDSCSAPAPMVPGNYPSLYVGLADSDFYSIVIPPQSVLDVDNSTLSFDVDYRVYDGNCNLLSTHGSDWSLANTTGTPMEIIFEAYADPGNAADCTDYALEIDISLDPCQTTFDDSFENNDSCAGAFPLGNGQFQNLYVSWNDRDHYSFCLPAGGTVFCDAIFDNSQGDIDLFLWDASDVNCGAGFGSSALVMGFSGSDNETLAWTNVTGAGIQLVLEVNMHFSNQVTCNRYDLIIQGVGGCGMGSFGPAFCTSLPPNSSGFLTRLLGNLGSGVGSGLHLEVDRGPAGQFAYLLVGTGFQDPGLPVSLGQLCLATAPGNLIGRFNIAGTAMNSIGAFDSNRVFQNLSGTSQSGSGFDVPNTLPLPGAPNILAGSTWYYQVWHREPNGASGFSNGLPVQF